MRPDSAAQVLIESLADIEDSRITKDYDILVEAASEILRVVNLSSFEIIEDIFEPAFKAYTSGVLAEMADNPRVSVETELYQLIDELFYQVRLGKADLSAFFAAVLGKNL